MCESRSAKAGEVSQPLGCDGGGKWAPYRCGNRPPPSRGFASRHLPRASRMGGFYTHPLD